MQPNAKKRAPSAIQEFMTTVPHAIEPHESLAIAQERMNHLHVRHLPVRSGGRIVGLLSERDLELAMKFIKAPPTQVAVETVMTPDPYCVLPSALVASTAIEMAERRLGSALVVDQGGHLVGIFTATDALRALAAFAATECC